MFMAAMLSIVTKPYNSTRHELHLLAAEVLQECDDLAGEKPVVCIADLHSIVISPNALPVQ